MGKPEISPRPMSGGVRSGMGTKKRARGGIRGEEEPKEKSGRKSERCRSTEEPREPGHEGPWGGKGSPNHGSFGGKDVRNVGS